MTEWPKDDDRMVPIMQNGNDGLHYETLNKPMKSPSRVDELFCDKVNVTKRYLEEKNK